jgi:hypothetical protein
MKHYWIKNFPAAITVCDRNGIIVDMNAKACATFADEGGAELIGRSLYNCHNPHSCELIREMLSTGKNNIYTIEKNGIKKMICQQPWFEGGEVAGMVEISMELPAEMAHHVRS